jgi:formate/nitrite transporter FocA (FNT family)
MSEDAGPDGLVWVGRALSTLAVLFLAFDAIGKIARVAQVVEGTVKLGVPESLLVGIGITLLVCTALYVVPQTAVMGAILLTGYLGGAVAIHVRIENPWLTHALFPVYVGAFVWGGLFLRNPRLSALIPFVK